MAKSNGYEEVKKLINDVVSSGSVEIASGKTSSSKQASSSQQTALPSKKKNSEDYFTSRRKALGLNRSKVDNDYIRSFLDDSQRHMNSVGSDRNRMGFGTSKSVYESRKQTAEDLSKRSYEIRKYLDDNRDALDSESYASLKKYLDDFDKSSRQSLYAFYRDNQFYSQFESENEWNWYEKYNGKTTEELTSAVDQLEDGEEKKWLSSLAAAREYEDRKNYDLEAGQKEIDDLEAELERLKMEQNSGNSGVNSRPYAAGQQAVPETKYTVGYGITNNRPYAAGQQVLREETPEENRIRELEQEISRRKQYANQAKRIQESEAYANTVKNVDFDQFDDYVKSDDALYNWINDEQFRDSYESNYVNPQQGAVGGSQNHNAQIPAPLKSEFARKGYDRMNATEIAIYNYYHAKGGKEAAQKYLDSIQETLNRRIAEDMYGGIKDSTAAKIVFGAAVGLNQFGSNVENFFNTEDDYIAQTAHQLAGGMVREDLADEGKKIELLGRVSLGQIAYDTVSTIANMAPSILASYAVGAAAGTLGLSAKTAKAVGSYTGSAMMGISAAGGAYQQALKEGFDKDQAKGYGILVGASEVVMEKLLGGISAVGGNALGINMTKNIANADTALKAIAKRLGGSMISEFREEYLQEVLEPVFSNIMLKTDKEVKPISVEALYSGILGLLSAGFMEGPTTIFKEVKTANTGRSIKANENISVDKLAQIGSTFAADSVAYKLASKVDENTGAYTIGKLFNEIGASLTQQNVNDISEALMKEGVGEISAKEYASAFARVVNGQKMPNGLVRAMEADPILAKVARETLIDANSTVNQRTQGYNEVLRKLAMDKVKGKKSSKVTPANDQQMTGKLTTEESTAVENENAPSGAQTVEGRDIHTGTQEAVSTDKIKSITKDGVVFAQEDGSEVSSKDVAYADAEDGLIFEAFTEMRELGTDAANEIISIRRKAGGSGQLFSNVMRIAYEYGYANLSESGLLAKIYHGNIPNGAVQRIYQIGKEARAAEDARRAQAKKSIVGGKTEVYRLTETGEVKQLGEGKEALKVLAVNERKSVGVKTAQFLQKIGVGGNYYFIQSYTDKDGNRLFLDRNGNVQDAHNGMYYSNGDIYIDLNAEVGSSGITLFTISHELAHFVQQWNSEKYKVLADFLAKHYAKNGASAYRAIKIKQQTLSEARGTKVSFEEAYHEFVADSLSTMFSDGNIYKKLLDLKKTDKFVFDKIRFYINKLAQKAKAYYSGEIAPTTEGQFMQMQSRETIDRLQQLFADALVGASENYRNAETQKNTDQEVGVQYSDSETLSRAANDLETISDEKYLADKSEFPFVLVMDHTPQIVLDSMKNDGGVSEAKNRRIIIRRDALYLAIREEGIQEGHYHGLGADVIKKLPQYLEQPDAILQTDGSANRRLVLTHIEGANGQAIVSVEFESIKDFEGKNEYYNVIITVFDLHQNYLKGLFKKREAVIRYEKEDLAQVNPQLHKWLRTFNAMSSSNNVTQPDSAVKKKLSDRDTANLHRDYMDAVKRGDMKTAQQMFADALVGASENYRNAETQKNTDQEVGVQMSVSEGNARFIFRDGVITKDTSEQERYSILRHVSIKTAEVSRTAIAEIDMDKLDTRKKSTVIPVIKELASKLNILNVDLENSYINFPFEFSVRNLNKSLHHQLEYGGTYQDYAKAITCFKDILKNAIPIETHTEKKEGTRKANHDLKEVYVLVGCFEDGQKVVPVQMEVKVFWSAKPNLYLNAVLTKIDSEVLEKAPAAESGDTPSLFSESKYTIESIFKNVNPKDWRFLKYVPDGFLNDRQKQAKSDAMTRQKEEYESYGVQASDSAEPVSNRSLLANALESLAKTELEKKKLTEYKAKIDQINAEEQKLSEVRAQIKELSFAKGPRDKEKLRALRDEAIKLSHHIGIYDKQLLRLEASKPLQNVLDREKAKAYQRGRAKGEAALERSRESRNKTAMRHKIQNVVKELNSLLLTNDKKRHVPDNLKKAVAAALDLVNMDTVDAENRAAKYADLIAKEQAKANPDQDKIDSYTMTMENILRQGEKMGQRIKELHAAYEEIQNSDDPDIANAYDPVIAGAIQELSATIGNTSIKNMTMDQLSDVYDVYRAVLTRVRDANKAMAENIRASIEELAKSTIREVQTVGGSKKYRVSNLDDVRKFDWNNMKPVYAMERIGSSTLTEVFNNVRAGEDTWAKDISEAREYYLEKSKKYGYDKWDFDKKYRFESNSGIPFELTLEQILSLYAYSKREQAADHLRLGGFVFDSNIETYMEKDGKKSLLKYKVNTADAHQITPEIMADIIGKLSKEQTGFVDEMQDYLSTVMGAKGNEVTSKMYGVKLFKEKFYFPLKSAKQFMFEQNEVSGEVRIKNSGFTNKVVAKANNPVILSNFMDVWSGHVNDMSMYHAFTLPLEDFNRVFNYNSPKRDGVESVSVKGTIQNAYGPAASSYVKQLITDLNGGARTDSTTGVINKLTGMFKKGAVFASLSVVVQQPSAIARAAALVDTKYFIGPKVDQKRHKYLWAEVKKYAPVAIIKEMGYFDTNMGKSTQDFITGKEYSGIKEQAKAVVTDSAYRDELLSKAPALADEYAWCGIWAAVKRETKAKHPSMDTTSEAFLKLCGKRFTEVITKTQVYDSVLARSANMRSKDTGMKMATAFMAEPTTSINMIEDAIWKAVRGDKKYARKAIGAVIASQILNAILVSFVYAGRDDDEDETYAEKYIGALTGSLADGLNATTYIPFIKDIVSIVQGYDVERSDMAVVSDLWNAWKNLKNDKVSPYRKVENFTGSIAQIFGLPVKNIMRDVRGIYNTITNLAGAEQTTGSGMKYAISGAITGKSVSDKEQLYKARLDGDQQHAARVAARYDDEDSANAAVRAAIKDGFMADEIDEATALKHMVLYAGMDGSEAHWTMDAWKYRKKVGSDEGYGKYGKFHDAVRSGNNLADVIKEYTDNGVKTSTLTGEITDEFKPLYLEASVSDRKSMKAKLVDAYVVCGMEREDAEKKLESWDFEAEYGFAYSDRKEAYLSGKVSKVTMVDILIDRGYDEEDAEAQVESYEWEAAGFEDVTTSAIRNYNEWCEPAGIPKSVYLEFWRFDNSTENDVDEATGKKIAYSAVKKIMAYIDSLDLSDRQKDALAKSAGWADKTIQKYKLW